jgi:hypothetical protein
MKLTKLSTLLLISFSPFLMANSCHRVERPNTDIYGVNVPDLSVRGYNLKKDYDDDGNRKPDAKPFVVKFPSELEMLQYLNKSTCTNPDGLANLKAYLVLLRKQIDNDCSL